MPYGQSNPIINGDANTWGTKLNTINTNSENWTTKGQIAYTLPLSKGNGTYRLHTYNRVPVTLEKLRYGTDTGTLTITAVQINGTNVTGLTALSASTTAANATATAANIVGNDARIDIVIASVTNATELYLNFEAVQTGERY
ncbi:MAG: hypothetical protein ACKO96_05100 [Flammeovirgaceae bacterium]